MILWYPFSEGAGLSSNHISAAAILPSAAMPNYFNNIKLRKIPSNVRLLQRLKQVKLKRNAYF